MEILLNKVCVNFLFLLSIVEFYRIRKSVKLFSEIRYILGLVLYSKQMFAIRISFGFISVFGLTAFKLLKLEITVCFIASSFRVTGENCLFEKGQSNTPSLF